MNPTLTITQKQLSDFLLNVAVVGICDILDRGRPDWWKVGEGITLDDFYP